jgi:hypothetical protein
LEIKIEEIKGKLQVMKHPGDDHDDTTFQKEIIKRNGCMIDVYIATKS